MKKLTLELDALQVESFDVSPDQDQERGTVRAHDYTNDLDCWGDNDDKLATCDYSCDTCDYSCNGTCGEGTCFGDTCVCWPPA